MIEDKYSFRNLIGVKGPTKIELEGILSGSIKIFPKEIIFSLWPHLEDAAQHYLNLDNYVKVKLQKPHHLEMTDKLMHAKHEGYVVRVSGNYEPSGEPRRICLGKFEADTIEILQQS